MQPNSCSRLYIYICTILPGIDISATSSRARHTGVAVPSSHKASYAAKNEVTDFLWQQKLAKLEVVNFFCIRIL